MNLGKFLFPINSQAVKLQRLPDHILRECSDENVVGQYGPKFLSSPNHKIQESMWSSLPIKEEVDSLGIQELAASC